jgi:hypothetical protein
MSSREHGRGSGRKRAPDRAVLAMISSANAMIGDVRCGDGGSAARGFVADRRAASMANGAFSEKHFEIGGFGTGAKPSKAQDGGDPH